MNSRECLQNAINALLSMKSDAMVSALLELESLQERPAEDLQPLATDLKRAAGLARASSELWSEVCECASINAAGYSALGIAALEPHHMGDLRG